MAPVVGFIGAVGAISIGATTVGAIVTNLVVGYAISALASTFLKKPTSGASFDSGLNITNTDISAPLPIIFGRSKFAGVRRFHELSNANRWLHFVNVYAAHEVDAIEKIYVDDKEVSVDADGWVTSGPYQGIMRIKTYRGTVDQEADPYLLANAPSFTSSMWGRGCAIACVSAKWDTDAFSSEPSVSLLMRGAKVYDPRDETQDIDDHTTWKWSRNAILCAAHYERGIPKPDHTGGLRRLFGTNANDNGINWNEIAAEANICDEPVNLKEGGTQPRYTVDGIMFADTNPDEGVQALLKSCAGIRLNSGGILSLRAGAARTPVMHFEQSDFQGPVSIAASRPLAQTFNGVKGQYRGARSNYEPDDAPPFIDETLVAKDGRESWLDLPLPFTDDPAAAQRIQRIALSENRRDKSITFPAPIRAIKLKAGDWFTVTLPNRGWVNKTFSVVTWRFASLNSGNDAAPIFGVMIEAQEVDAGIFTWDPDAEHIVTPPPPLNLPSPIIVPPPTLNTPEIVEWRDRALVRLSVTEAVDGPPVKYRFSYRPTGTVPWINLADRIETTVDVRLDVGSYDFRVISVAQPYGGQSLPSPQPLGYLTWEVGKPPITQSVTGLELVGGGPNGTFTGRDAIFKWRQSRPLAHGFDIPFGADVDQQDPTFDGYRVEVRTMPLPGYPDGLLLREQRLTDTRFEYTFEMNYRDCKNLGLRSAQRAFRFGVWQISRYGMAEEYSIPVYIDVSNPAPIVPIDLTITALFSELRVSFTAPDDPDFEGSVLWASKTQGFDPAATTPIFLGRGNFISYELEPNQTYYVRMAAYDAFIGDYDPTDVPLLNLSQEVTIETRALDIDVPRFSFDGLNIRPNEDGDGVVWDAGTVVVASGNSSSTYLISAGDAPWSGGELYVYYRDGRSVLDTATLLQDAQFSDSVVLAVYRGGTAIARPDGGVLYDGGLILARTIGSQQLVTGQAVITEGAQIANAIIGDAQVDTLSANKLKANSVIGNKIYVGEDLLIEMDGTPGAQRIVFYEVV